jgi:16S rRNA (cytosine967-C5)-methyltransferase
MTPAARHAAAIEVLDAWFAGAPVERALTAWGHASRFAGSSDRAAVRDVVFDALRRRRSAAWAGGADSGRGLVLGLMRLTGRDPAEVFGADRYAPPAATADEAGAPLSEAPRAVRLDLPDWLLPAVEASLGPDTEAVMTAMQTRAPIFLRVNSARSDRAGVALSLAAEDISTVPHPQVRTALEVTGNARKLAASASLAMGLVEPQDAHSQAVVEALGPVRGLPVLDYCAGAGGKALHLASEGALVTAHDADPRRMRDLGPRAARAGVRVNTVATEALAGLDPWPLVLVDAPCSGSGTWRRDPELRWRLTPEGLADLLERQSRILTDAAALVAPGGLLSWVTCSILDAENGSQVARFLDRNAGWVQDLSLRLLPGAAGDGFGIAILRRVPHT